MYVYIYILRAYLSIHWLCVLYTCVVAWRVNLNGFDEHVVNALSAQNCLHRLHAPSNPGLVVFLQAARVRPLGILSPFAVTSVPSACPQTPEQSVRC